MRLAAACLLAPLLALESGCSGCGSRPGAKSGPVVAEGRELVVTAGELRARIDEAPAQLRARYAGLEQKKELLETILRFELLAREARRQGLDRDPEVQATLKKLAVQRLLREQLDGRDRATDATEARRYYDEHRDEFVKPERVRAQLVWLDAPEGSPQRAARAGEVRRLLARLKADEPRNPLAFSNLARESSQDAATRAAGGDLGYRTREELAAQYSEELAAAALALSAPGQTSGVVETRRGLALLKLTARQPAVNRTFEEVKEQLAARAVREKRGQELDALVKGLLDKASVTIHDRELEKIAVAGLPGAETAPAGPPPAR